MIVLAVQEVGDTTIVTVAPITHSPPEQPGDAIEIPALTKARLGLDRDRSWIMATEFNSFVWPGVDLRPISRGSDVFAYGHLPANLLRDLRTRILTLAKAGRVQVTGRDT